MQDLTPGVPTTAPTRSSAARGSVAAEDSRAVDLGEALGERALLADLRDHQVVAEAEVARDARLERLLVVVRLAPRRAEAVLRYERDDVERMLLVEVLRLLAHEEDLRHLLV